jgi:Flp pilus assembly protein TadB
VAAAAAGYDVLWRHRTVYRTSAFDVYGGAYRAVEQTCDGVRDITCDVWRRRQAWRRHAAHNGCAVSSWTTITRRLRAACIPSLKRVSFVCCCCCVVVVYVVVVVVVVVTLFIRCCCYVVRSRLRLLFGYVCC